MNVIPEIGKTYLDRIGSERGPLKPYGICFLQDKQGRAFWRENGQHFGVGSRQEWDLIKEKP